VVVVVVICAGDIDKYNDLLTISYFSDHFLAFKGITKCFHTP
jgi:hypothetical protein